MYPICTGDRSNALRMSAPAMDSVARSAKLIVVTMNSIASTSQRTLVAGGTAAVPGGGGDAADVVTGIPPINLVESSHRSKSIRQGVCT